MSKHTPGPWTYYSGPLRPGFSTTKIHEIQCGQRAIVKWPGFDGVDLPPREIRANARLIAAAPDAVEALRGLLEWVRRDNPGPIADSALASWVDSAEAAIAKAEGR